jgi:hypothetical protein
MYIQQWPTSIIKEGNPGKVPEKDEKSSTQKRLKGFSRITGFQYYFFIF